MVQQLSLYASVSENEQAIVVKSLAAISGMSPRPLDVTVHIWEPTNPFRPRLAAGQVNQIEQYRIFALSNGTIEVHEVPEPGRNLKVISQTVLSTKILEGSVDNFLKSLGYGPKSKYTIKGLEFVLKPLNIHIFRLLNPDSGQLIEPSGRWVVKVFAEVESVTDLPAVERATNELTNFQQEFRSLLNLQVLSRGSFNTRVRRPQ